ncbi:hypothetical protein [Pseudomonas sp. Marseille-QA0892]
MVEMLKVLIRLGIIEPSDVFAVEKPGLSHRVFYCLSFSPFSGPALLLNGCTFPVLPLGIVISRSL